MIEIIVLSANEAAAVSGPTGDGAGLEPRKMLEAFRTMGEVT